MPKLIDLRGSQGFTEEHRITKAEMIEMARAYREQRHSGIKKHGNNANDSRTCWFHKDVYMAIFGQNCTGIRTYYGVKVQQDQQGKKHNVHTLILVGTRDGKPALLDTDYVAIAANPEETDIMYDWGSLCPPGDDCGQDTLLEEVDEDIAPSTKAEY
ncbi:MAG: hypothetical protein ACO1OQ_02570 [Rufibacter sp.]